LVVRDGIGRLRGEDGDTLRAKELDRRRLGAVQVAGADETGATGAQRHQQRHGFRLKMDSGADRSALEGPCRLEFGSRRLQQPAAVGDPVDTGDGDFRHVRPSPFPFLPKAQRVPNMDTILMHGQKICPFSSAHRIAAASREAL
jgi:hypothetical protein